MWPQALEVALIAIPCNITIITWANIFAQQQENF
jgi:hypothetical protein